MLRGRAGHRRPCRQHRLRLNTDVRCAPAQARTRRTCPSAATGCWSQVPGRGTLAAVVAIASALVTGPLAGLLTLAAPSLGIDVGGKAKGAAKDDEELSKRTDRPWIQRWAPERGMMELGVFGGIFLPSANLELFEPNTDRPGQGVRPYASLAPDVGLRFAYLPIRHFGIEVEGAYMPTTTTDFDLPVNMFSARGHVIGQIGLWSVTPFAVVGAGGLGVLSEDYAVGNDVDPAIHMGVGAKFFVNRRIMVRLDLRDNISPKVGLDGGAANNFEALLGLSITFGRERDRDKGPEAEPQPQPQPQDSDGDGFLDPDDKCPAEPGVAPDGCPPPADTDGDGFIDPEDKCPQEPGIAPDGCPDRDPDGDGILDPDDQCPTDPETFNGFEDEDGCPDVPDEVRSFEGSLPGVNFDLGKATLRPGSSETLDKVVETLKKFEDVRVEISGHTDDTGSRGLNMRLSGERAATVRQYLVEHGIDAGRIESRGAGPDEPVDSNASKAGRANNRRIEFRVLN